MLRKDTMSNWYVAIAAITVLLAALIFAFSKSPKPEGHFWFVSYEWVKQKERGAGRTCIEIKEDGFDINTAENDIKDKKQFDTLIINNFIPISKKSYALCIKQP
jgi:hypothetical protein